MAAAWAAVPAAGQVLWTHGEFADRFVGAATFALRISADPTPWISWKSMAPSRVVVLDPLPRRCPLRPNYTIRGPAEPGMPPKGQTAVGHWPETKPEYWAHWPPNGPAHWAQWTLAHWAQWAMLACKYSKTCPSMEREAR